MEEMTLKKCIEFAVATEGNGARFYNHMAGKFAASPEMSDLFKSLGKDETVHRKKFSKLLSKVPQDSGVSNAPEQSEYLRAMSISEFFSHRRGPFKDADKIKGMEEALEKAFDFEKATLGFYQAVQDVLGRNRTLTNIIKEEKSHITRIMKSMITGEKFRSLQDKWA
jgi:rubrerythrin